MAPEYTDVPDYRLQPRISAESLASEVRGDSLSPALVVELSETGLRLERPFVGGRLERLVQLEFEIPEIDEIVWAAATPAFDRVHRRRAIDPGHRGKLVRTSGFRIVSAPRRSLRLLRDYVVYARERAAESAWGLRASCYRRG